MSLSVISINTRGYIFFILIIFSLILFIIIIFHQQHIDKNSYIPISSSIKEQNDLVKQEHFPLIHQPLSLSILRGIVIFYPNDQEEHFLPELLWLYRSWIEMMKDEPSSWRTDLIIYTQNYTSNLQQLGCIYNQIRINRQDPPECRIFPYKRISLRTIHDTPNTHEYLHQEYNRHRSILLITYLHKYEYLDSVNIIAECYPSFSMYDYILRTDIDVFLTKNFGHFVPYNNTLLVGRGAYSTKFSNNRLRRIANDMNWLHANITNIGSTWYGPPQIAQRVAKFCLKAMLYLAINEFTTPERLGRLRTLLWPEWHFGVLTMYGCHLAFNHLILNENINLGLAYDLLDQSSIDKDPYDLEKNNRLHLHCWHDFEDFSKFSFKSGEYNHLHPNKFLNDTSAAGFAMRMALESRLMSLTELKQKRIDAKNS